jgi:hypothetical protein
LYGKSGLGKSSLLDAGVLPRLEAERRYFIIPLRVGGYTPGDLKHPLDIVDEKPAGLFPQENFLNIIELNTAKAATQSRFPGVNAVAFCAQQPHLRFALLMDMDFAVSCLLVEFGGNFGSKLRRVSRFYRLTPSLSPVGSMARW